MLMPKPKLLDTFPTESAESTKHETDTLTAKASTTSSQSSNERINEITK